MKAKAVYYTLSGKFALSFEGSTTCTEALQQSGQIVLDTATGALVASGSTYSETTTSATSTGVAGSLAAGSYQLVYTETIYSPKGWSETERAPQCGIEGDYTSCTTTSAFTLTNAVPSPREKLGGQSGASPDIKPPCTGDPINCETGDLTETQSDLKIGGRGPGLQVVRTYNSLAAAEATEAGPFGYGWSGPYSAHLEVDAELQSATVVEDKGNAVDFTLDAKTGEYAAPAWIESTLKKQDGNYLYTLPNQTTLEFDGEGRLIKEAERNGNAITLAYTEGRLQSATDSAGRQLRFNYTAAGQVESIIGPMGETVNYTYDSGELTTVTLPEQPSPRWRFGYNASHLLTSVTNGRGYTTVNEYNAANQVSSQSEPGGRKRELNYTQREAASETKITEPNGSETLESFDIAGLETKAIHAAGTSIAASTEYEYNSAEELVKLTDPANHVTKYGYDSAGDKTSEKNAEGHETVWTYNSRHEITSETLPSGETTSIEYDAHGNPITVSRPAPKEETQETRYEYNSRGEMTAMIDPLGAKWVYGYDEAGDRISETTPEGDTTTWAYNEDSQETSEVSPAGNAAGGEPGKYTTSIDRNALGQPVKLVGPEGQETLYQYNADGSQTAVTDANGHKTTTTYNADEQPTIITRPSGATSATEYNDAGQIVAQRDGLKHNTTYVRNALGQVTEVIDALEQKTIKTYDPAGNLATVTNPEGDVTTYAYNAENRLTTTGYSRVGSRDVEYGYNADGQILSMSDGTGTTSYSYDQLGRLTGTTDGHGSKVAYAYNLANELTAITYPNNETVKDSYDKAGRLAAVGDWLGHSVSFAYNANSQVATESFPGESGESDQSLYDRAGQLAETKMLKGSATLASLNYGHDGLGAVTREARSGLPGAPSTEYTYNEDEQLKSAGSTDYEYDPTGDPTKLGATSQTWLSCHGCR